MPLPKEKHDESLHSAHEYAPKEEDSDSDAGYDPLEFPEVPNASVQPRVGGESAPAMIPPPPSAPHPQVNNEVLRHSDINENILPHAPHPQLQEATVERTVVDLSESPDISVKSMEDKQFVPFISPPITTSPLSARLNNPTPPPALSNAKTNADIDLQDVLAAAQAAAETAERAAAAARAAANLAQVRIAEIMKKSDQGLDSSSENPFHSDTTDLSPTTEKPHVDLHNNSLGDSGGVSNPLDAHQVPEDYQATEAFNLPSYDRDKAGINSSPSNDHVIEDKPAHHQPQRLPSMDDDSYFSYPNLFNSQGSNLGSHGHPSMDNSRSTHEQ